MDQNQQMQTPRIDPEVKRQAEEEFKAELHKQAVEKYKEHLRLRKNFWVRVFPWRLRLVRRDVPEPTRYEKCLYHVNEMRKLGYQIDENCGGWIIRHEGSRK